jgi:hypothetical protein
MNNDPELVKILFQMTKTTCQLIKDKTAATSKDPDYMLYVERCKKDCM